MASPLFVADIKEKEITEGKAPSFPQLKASASGFPEPRKRNRISAFKQKRQGIPPDDQKPKVFLSSSDQPLNASAQDTRTASAGQNFEANEKRSIDRENSQKLASMSPQEIEQARQELFNGLDPSILEMLVKRANLDDGAASTSVFDQPEPIPEATAAPSSDQADTVPEIRIEDTSIRTSASAIPKKPSKSPDTTSANSDTASAQSEQPSDEPSEHDFPSAHAETLKEPTPPEDDTAPSIPPTEHIISPSAPTLESAHWPRTPQPADLDPSDPNFLQNLHAKYFPSLPADPSKLAWMAPIPTPHSAADRDSPYYPGQSSLPISSLRFDFRGALLPPRISRAIRSDRGLHHHGEAPEAAGYTIRELARLARSAVPGQRCLSYQTLGRLLYRLGAGEWGGVGRDDLSLGIWREVEEGAVLRSLGDEVGNGEEGSGRGHRSARVFATEAIWLFEKGGWKEKLKKANLGR